ncbi:MAG: excinuclease ABC subunit UvrC [Akkermansiaceae bacterium]
MSSKLPELRARMHTVPLKPGVYIMRDRLGHVIYVGKAKVLRKRLGSYFLPSRKKRADIKTRALLDSVWDFETHTVRNEEEALILEEKLIKQYRPRYNIALKDDKRYFLVKIDLEAEFPIFKLCRIRRNDGYKYFGPFVHGGALIATLDWINKEFGIWTQAPKGEDDPAYKQVGEVLNRRYGEQYVGEISNQEYRERVADACALLSGKGRRDKVNRLKHEMDVASSQLDFEKAAELRDVIDNLEKTTIKARQFAHAKSIPTTVLPAEDLAELGDYLRLPRAPGIMECFDISNVSSTHSVASMVRFLNGAPDNSNYRRYRIKTVEGQDDFASMAEVVRRRYYRIAAESMKENPELEHTQEDLTEVLYRLRAEGRSPIALPDLVIVDGGKGQLSAAHAELTKLGLHDLPIIGLAKQREEIFFPGNSKPLRIDHNQGALKLMQRIRDEAHRYANLYNELLLKKRMRESLLDDCPGMTESRKNALLKKFGSIAKIKKATQAQIESTPGIGPLTAEKIIHYFH